MSLRRARPGLVIVEGIMGSGKSTTAEPIAGSLERAGRRARAIPELPRPHPLRATDELAHWYEPWLDVTAADLAARSLARWRTFVDAGGADDPVSVLDGQLFHGDLTNLFRMGAAPMAIAAYSRAAESFIRRLAPLVVYF